MGRVIRVLGRGCEGTRDARRCRKRADTRRASLRTNRGFTWITWDRVAPPGESRTPEPRRRDPLVQPQSISNSWLWTRDSALRGGAWDPWVGRGGTMRTCECRAGKGSIRRVSPFVSARRVVRSARSAIRPRNLQTSQLRGHRGRSQPLDQMLAAEPLS